MTIIIIIIISYHPNQFAVLKDGKYGKLENFPGWGLPEIHKTAERGQAAIAAVSPDHEW